MSHNVYSCRISDKSVKRAVRCFDRQEAQDMFQGNTMRPVMVRKTDIEAVEFALKNLHLVFYTPESYEVTEIIEKKVSEM